MASLKKQSTKEWHRSKTLFRCNNEIYFAVGFFVYSILWFLTYRSMCLVVQAAEQVYSKEKLNERIVMLSVAVAQIKVTPILMSVCLR